MSRSGWFAVRARPPSVREHYRCRSCRSARHCWASRRCGERCGRQHPRQTRTRQRASSGITLTCPPTAFGAARSRPRSARARAGSAAWPATTRTARRSRWRRGCRWGRGGERAPGGGGSPPPHPASGSVWFATTDPVYADKTNATAVHAALDLQPGILAADLGATVRSGIVALLAAARDGGLAVLADRRGGPVGGTDEREGADAAAAFLFGERDPLARIVDTASVTAEFIDRWRAPGAAEGATWEERFGEQRYAELAGQLLARLSDAGVELGGVRRFAV